MSLFNSMWRELEYGFRMGNMVRKLMLVNIVIFVLVQILHLGTNIYAGGMEGGYLAFWDILHYFCMPSDWKELLSHLWTPFTSIFLHEGVWHLVGNMIWLSLFGTIVGDLIGDRRVLPIYLIGGLAGGLTYFLSANLSTTIGTHALGASAAVMAFGGAAIILNPDYRVGLLLLGEVKIKYIVLFMVLIDLVSVTGNQNAGGHAAHLGGFLSGILFVYALRDRKDWSEPINHFLDKLGQLLDAISHRLSRRKSPKMKITYSKKNNSGKTAPTREEMNHQEKIDAILDKIKQKGFDQLSQEDKDFLYNASKK
jgi:membrane associated rhomboid family serine protease